MNEPKLIDIIAMLAMHALLREVEILDHRNIAEEAYDIAEEMVKESNRRAKNG